MKVQTIVQRVKQFDIFDRMMIVLCLFHGIANTIWINLNTAPLPWDQAGHTVVALKFYEYINGTSQESIAQISQQYAPFVHFTTALVMSLVGPNPLVGSYVTTAFFIACLVFLYLYIVELTHDKTLAFMSSLLFSLLPPVYAASRWLLLDIPLTALFLSSLFFLEKSNGLTHKKYSILFTVFLSATLLAKEQAIVYFIIPLMFKAKQLLRANKKTLLAFGAAVLLVVSPWYLVNASAISQFVQFFYTGEPGDPQQVLSAESIFYYLYILINFSFTLFGFLFLLFALYWTRYVKLTARLLLTVLFTYVVFTFVHNKDSRYILPILPFLAVIVAYPFATFIKQRLFFPAFLFPLLISYYLLYFFMLSFGFPLDPTVVNYQRAIKVPVVGWIDYVNLGKDTSFYLAPRYNQEAWPNDTIVEDVYASLEQRRPHVLVVVDKRHLNTGNLQLAANLAGYGHIHFESPYSTDRFEDYPALERYVAYFSMALVVDQSFGPADAIRHAEALTQLKEYMQSRSDVSQPLREYQLPDGDTVTLYNITM
ncbi:glycosyltransferase family 39 protein [Candidatus Roizmanbacteria bacterium]|nr:glycosyltransferase family 39 protein [Candidatus Roizmanbacteria bacterium]